MQCTDVKQLLFEVNRSNIIKSNFLIPINSQNMYPLLFIRSHVVSYGSSRAAAQVVGLCESATAPSSTEQRFIVRTQAKWPVNSDTRSFYWMLTLNRSMLNQWVLCLWTSSQFPSWDSFFVFEPPDWDLCERVSPQSLLAPSVLKPP